MAKQTDPPVVLIKWYDFTKWLLDRVDSFPKNQRFIFGQRLTDHAMDILELLVEATYSARKSRLHRAFSVEPDHPQALLLPQSSRQKVHPLRFRVFIPSMYPQH